MSDSDQNPAGQNEQRRNESRIREIAAKATATAAKLAGTAGVLHGQATLVNGASVAQSAPGLSATSSIQCTVRAPGAATALTVNYASLNADRVLGAAGTFLVKALVAAGTINAADDATIVDWVVVL